MAAWEKINQSLFIWQIVGCGLARGTLGGSAPFTSPFFLSPSHTIHIEPLAPVKPDFGKACNGCGVCCLAEPCPLGVLLSRSRSGPCKALVWEQQAQQYRCGALGPKANGLRARMVGRWIAAGSGCDCDLEPAPSATISTPSPHSGDRPHD